MKDWNNLEADVNVIMNKHYTEGRDSKIQKVFVHINAGNLTTEDCFRVWQTREASAHYQVEASGRIGQLVWDADTAWSVGNWEENTRSISIEHANSTMAPNWEIGEKTLEEGAHLVAAICKYYGLGRPEWGKNVFGHSDVFPTACPGAIKGSQRSKYMSRAQAHYDSMVGGKKVTPAAQAKANAESYSQFVDRLAREVIDGKWGNGDARVSALGQHYNAVQNRVNEILGVGSAPVRETFDVEAAAQAVIRGEYGNGDERVRRLGKWYGAVQNRVNQILLG